MNPRGIEELYFDKIEPDSLNALIREGYDLSELDVDRFIFGTFQDSITIVKILEALKPVSYKVTQLSFYTPYRINISSLSHLKVLDIYNVGGVQNKSILYASNIERIFINGKSNNVKLNVIESDPIFMLAIEALTIHLDTNDNMYYESISNYSFLRSIEIKDPNLRHIPDSFSELKALVSCSFYEHSINDKSINTLLELPNIKFVHLESNGEFPKIYWWLLKKNKKNIKIKTSTVTKVYVSGDGLKGKDLRFASRLKRKLRNEQEVKIEYQRASKSIRS